MRPVALLALLALLLAAGVTPALAGSSGAGDETVGGGPPLTESMEGAGRPATEEPQLARTGSEALVVALAGAGLLLCGAGLRLRLRASE